MFFAEGGGRTAGLLDVDVRNAFGLALNVGMGAELAPNWLMNIDVKKLFIGPDVAVDTALGQINATADLDPWIMDVGVRYRFEPAGIGAAPGCAVPPRNARRRRLLGEVG